VDGEAGPGQAESLRSPGRWAPGGRAGGAGDGERYAARLRAAGVPTRHTRYPGMIHGFFVMLGRLDQAQQAVDEAREWLDTVL
jgi:acetyl esterase/lipase